MQARSLGIVSTYRYWVMSAILVLTKFYILYILILYVKAKFTRDKLNIVYIFLQIT